MNVGDELLTIGKWQVVNRKDYDVTIICYGQNVNLIREFFKDKNY